MTEVEEQPRGRPHIVTKNIHSIYIPNAALDIWRQFKTSMREDGSSASAQIIAWIQDWYKTHPDRQQRNPQTALDRPEFVVPTMEKQGCPKFDVNCKFMRPKDLATCFYRERFKCQINYFGEIEKK